MIFSVFQKIWVLEYSWSTLLWYRCYYPHRSRDALSPVCGMFCMYLKYICLNRGQANIISLYHHLFKTHTYLKYFVFFYFFYFWQYFHNLAEPYWNASLYIPWCKARCTLKTIDLKLYVKDIASLRINLRLKTVQLSSPTFGHFCE